MTKSVSNEKEATKCMIPDKPKSWQINKTQKGSLEEDQYIDYCLKTVNVAMKQGWEYF